MVLKCFKNPPLATESEENTCLSIYQNSKRKLSKNWLRRPQIKHTIHAESEVNSRTKFATVQKREIKRVSCVR